MIEATAPVRVGDLGGWTDTWFGGPGRVLNIAVTPGVQVRIAKTAEGGPVLLELDTFGERYTVVPGRPRAARHPLVEAAVDASPPSPDVAVAIRVSSGIPPGCGTGTSAAVAVALLGALAAARSERPMARQIAYEAHRLEVEVLGQESGIQDQLCAAQGGINYLEIETYPDATVETLPAWDDLGPLLTLVYLGRAHHSSAVHRQVIEDISSRGRALCELRHAAAAARQAVLAHDAAALGRAMIDNTEAQARLHPALVGRDARRVIEVAAARQARGWKVNGAGGDGGSLTVLSATPAQKEELERRLVELDASYQVIPIQVSAAGLRVTGSL